MESYDGNDVKFTEMIIISQSVKFKTVTLNFKSKESVRGT